MMSPDGVSVHCAQLGSHAKFPIGDATYERTATPAKLLSRMSSMDGREGGREGSRERQRHVAPLPRLLQCLDNIMLCVHLHKYWGWVFRRKRNRRSVKNALIKIVKIISSSFLILSKYLFSKYGYEFDQRI